MYENRNKRLSIFNGACLEAGHYRCRDLGGERDSHHSLTLRRLVVKGLVTQIPLVQNTLLEKSLFAYKISDEGINVWQKYDNSPCAVKNGYQFTLVAQKTTHFRAASHI
jgi:hypothetical protein